MWTALAGAFEGLSRTVSYVDKKDRLSLARAFRVLARNFRDDDDESLGDADSDWHDATSEWDEDELRRDVGESWTGIEDEAGVVINRLSETSAAPEATFTQQVPTRTATSGNAVQKQPKGLPLLSLLRKSGDYVRHIGLTDLWGLPPKYWTDGNPTMFMLRGPNYLKDRVKVRASQSAFELDGVDVFDVPSPIFHIASHPRSFLSRGQQQGPRPFTFVVQIMNPGQPPELPYISIGLYFRLVKYASLDELLESGTPLGVSLKRFISAPEEERKLQFKLIIGVNSRSPLLLRTSIPNKPVIPGKVIKMPVHINREQNYMEVDLYTMGSAWCTRFYKMAVNRLASKAVVDLAFLLEGHSPEELPEELIGVAHVEHITPDIARKVEPMEP